MNESPSATIWSLRITCGGASSLPSNRLLIFLQSSTWFSRIMLPMDFTCATWDEVWRVFVLVDFSKKNTISLVGTWIVSWGEFGLCCWIVVSWLGPAGSILKFLGEMPGWHRREWEREEAKWPSFSSEKRHRFPPSEISFISLFWSTTMKRMRMKMRRRGGGVPGRSIWAERGRENLNGFRLRSLWSAEVSKRRDTCALLGKKKLSFRSPFCFLSFSFFFLFFFF